MNHFQIIPAIDLIDGRAVRLFKGDYKKVTVYSSNPLAVVAGFIAAGASRIHIIDLDAARAGQPVNLPVVKKIIKMFKVPVQLGGGLRSIETLKKVLDIGVDRVILGTAALTDKSFLKKALRLAPQKIVAAVDAFGKNVAIKGWTKKTGWDLFETARELAAAGVPRILYTDITRDGTLGGPSLTNLKKLAESLAIPVIASGGISSLADIKKVARLASKGIESVVIGKALYTGKVDLAEAISKVQT